MFLDFINSLIEDYFFLLFFLVYSSLKPSRLRILCYSFASILLSAFFTLSTSHNLVLNVGLLVGMQVLSFYSNKKAHYILNLLAFSTCAVASSILIELTTTSLLPDSLLQTYLGNLISNLICASSVTILFFFVRRRKNNNLISTFTIKYWYVILLILLLLIITGQIYLSRFSGAWKFVPGFIGVIFLLGVVICLSIYLRFVQRRYDYQKELYEKNQALTESMIAANKKDIHNYHSHINHLIGIINTSDTIREARALGSQYVNELENDRFVSQTILSIKEPLFRSLLFGWYTRCLEANVPFEFEATPLLPDFPIEDYLLVEMLGVLFDNALEHETELSASDRNIKIRLYADYKECSVTITNRLANLSSALTGLTNGESTKKGSHHGIGLSSARRIAQENNLSLTYTIDNTVPSVSFILAYERD